MKTKKHITLQKLSKWITNVECILMWNMMICLCVLEVYSPVQIEDFFQSLSIPFDYYKVCVGFFLVHILLVGCLFAVQYFLDKKIK